MYGIAMNRNESISHYVSADEEWNRSRAIERKYLRIKEVSNEINRLQAIYFKNRTDEEDMKLEQLIDTLNMLKGE